MDRRWILPLVFAAVVWFAGSLDALGVPGEDVVTLTPGTFEQEVGVDKGALVEFYTPWCAYSKQLAPEYEKLAGTFKKTRNVLIAKVDCDQHHSLCSKYAIKVSPTVKWFPKGSLEPKDYSGDRTVEALTEFVNNEEAGITTSGGNSLFLLLAHLLLA